MRTDTRKDTIEGLQEVTNALSNCAIPDSLWPALPKEWGFATPTKKSSRYYLMDG